MKNILIVGGSYGIGYAVAKSLYQAHNIYIASRTFENPENIKAIHLPFNVLSDSLISTELPEKLHGFIYCPGSINLKPFKNLSGQLFIDDLEINFHSMVKILHEILPKLLNSDAASIVVFSSVAAQNGMPFHTSVAASKGAVEGFAKAFAAEFAPKIRTNVIAPSLTNTPLAEKFLNNDTKLERSASRHPLRRVGQPEDIAAMAAFLLSDESSWITGQVFNVDGGLSTLQVN